MTRTIYPELTWAYATFTFLWPQICHPRPPSSWLCQRTFPAYFPLITSTHTLVAKACLGALPHLDEDVSLKKFPLAKHTTRLCMDHAKFDALLELQGGRTPLVDSKVSHFTVWTRMYDPEASWLARSKCSSQPRGSPFHFVALCGLRKAAEFPVFKRSQGVNDRRPSDNRSPSFMASEMGYVEVTRISLQHGVDADAQDDSNCTPLMALGPGYLEVVQVLLDHDVDANVWDSNNWSPLQVELHKGHYEIGRAILELSSNVNVLVKNYSTPLYPVSSGRMRVIRILLGGCAAVDAHNDNNWPPLHWASQNGHLMAAQVLLKYRADARSRNDDDQTPLHFASHFGPLDIQALLECGADANARGKAGCIPLHWSLEGKNLDGVRVLECGTDANLRRKHNQTPLYLASLQGQHLEIAQVLLEGADAAARDIDNWTPLYVVSRVGHLKIDQILLECGANANARDEKWDPMHRTSQGLLRFVQVLPGCGADTNTRDDDEIAIRIFERPRTRRGCDFPPQKGQEYIAYGK